MVLGNAQTTVVSVEHSTVAVHHVASRLPYRLDRPRRSSRASLMRSECISARACSPSLAPSCCAARVCVHFGGGAYEPFKAVDCPIRQALRTV